MASTSMSNRYQRSTPLTIPGKPWEWPGVAKTRRVVESPDGGFVCLYTAFDGKVGRLFVARQPPRDAPRNLDCGRSEAAAWSSASPRLAQPCDVTPHGKGASGCEGNQPGQDREQTKSDAERPRRRDLSDERRTTDEPCPPEG